MEISPQQFWKAGLFAFEEGEYEVAAHCFDAAIRSGMNQAAVWNNLAATQVLLAKWEEARWAFRRSLDLDPGQAHVWANYGRLLLRTQEWRSAATAFSRAADRDPGQIAYVAGEAFAWLREGKYPTAVSLLAPRLQPDHPDEHLHFLLIEGHLKSGDRAAARGWLNQAISAHSHQNLRLLYAALLLETGEAVEALEWLRPLPASPRQRYLLTLGLILSDQFQEASGLLQAVPRLLANREADMLTAWLQQATGQNEAALTTWEQLAQRHPESARILWGHASLLNALDHPEAETALLNLLGRYPDHTAAMWALVKRWRRLPERRKDVGLWLDKLIHLQSNRAEPRLERGFLLLDRGIADRAGEDFEWVLRKQPDLHDALLGAALAAADLGNHDRSVERFLRISALYPNRPESWWNLALAAMQADQRRLALEAVQHYRRLVPEDPDGRNLEGRILFSLGRTREAGEVWRASNDES